MKQVQSPSHETKTSTVKTLKCIKFMECEYEHILCFITPEYDFFFLAQQPPSGPGPPHSRGFYVTHNDAPQLVGLLWTSDQLVAEAST